MKEIVQQPGGRRYLGDDWLLMQDTYLKLTEGFYKQFGSFILSGCEANGERLTEGVVILGGKACLFNGCSYSNNAVYVKKVEKKENVSYKTGEDVGYISHVAEVCPKSDSGAFRLDGAKRFTDVLLPANATNADTVDGHHAHNFTKSYLEVSDWNDILTSDLNAHFLVGSKSAANSPSQTYFSAVMQYIDGNPAYRTLFGMDISGKPFMRTMGNNQWGAWINLRDADTLDGLHATALARAAGNHTFGNGSEITTAQLLDILASMGAFDQPVWIGRGSWHYAGNSIITDTGCGNIHLAGATVEVFSRGAGAATSKEECTIRITTPTSAIREANVKRAVFVYVNNGSGYSPGWFKLPSTYDQITPISGHLAVTPTQSGFREGIRIGKHGGWSAISLGVSNPAGSGTEDGAWSMLSNPSGFFTIAHNGSNENHGLTLYKAASRRPAYFGKELAYQQDIPTSLPANGGNADTLGGLHASSFASVGSVPQNYLLDLKHLSTGIAYPVVFYGYQNIHIHRDAAQDNHPSLRNNMLIKLEVCPSAWGGWVAMANITVYTPSAYNNEIYCSQITAHNQNHFTVVYLRGGLSYNVRQLATAKKGEVYAEPFNGHNVSYAPVAWDGKHIPVGRYESLPTGMGMLNLTATEISGVTKDIYSFGDVIANR